MHLRIAEQLPFEKTTSRSKSSARLTIVLGYEIQCHIADMQKAAVTDADRIGLSSLLAMPLDARVSRCSTLHIIEFADVAALLAAFSPTTLALSLLISPNRSVVMAWNYAAVTELPTQLFDYSDPRCIAPTIFTVATTLDTLGILQRAIAVSHYFRCTLVEWKRICC